VRHKTFKHATRKAPKEDKADLARQGLNAAITSIEILEKTTRKEGDAARADRKVTFGANGVENILFPWLNSG